MKLQFIKELIKNNNMVLFPPKYMHQHQLLQLCLQPVQGKMNYGHRKPWGLNSVLVTARGQPTPWRSNPWHYGQHLSTGGRLKRQKAAQTLTS